MYKHIKIKLLEAPKICWTSKKPAGSSGWDIPIPCHKSPAWQLRTSAGNLGKMETFKSPGKNQEKTL
jgi:hypothetical protein